eukprot:2672861-Heterocapsa_arctica.AAC.1
MLFLLAVPLPDVLHSCWYVSSQKSGISLSAWDWKKLTQSAAMWLVSSSSCIACATCLSCRSFLREASSSRCR